MYLLDQAFKIDESKNYTRSFLVEDGKVRYITTSYEKWNKQRISLSGTVMTNARVMYDENLLSCEHFEEFQKAQTKLIKQGCTTVLVAPSIQFEKQLEDEYKRAKHSLASSTIDFIIGLTIPASLLTPRLLRKCKNMRIPIVRVLIGSKEEMSNLKWTHLSQTLLTYPIVLVPVIKQEERLNNFNLIEIWSSYCNDFQVHSTGTLVPNEMWSKSMLQKVGLFPRKGTMLVGSDLDYLLFENKHNINSSTFHLENSNVASETTMFYHKKEPEIVVIRGELIKAKNEIKLKPGFGKHMDIKKPGRFLSISNYKEMECRQLFV